MLYEFYSHQKRLRHLVMRLQGAGVEAQILSAASSLRAVRLSACSPRNTPRLAFQARCSIYIRKERFRNAPMWPALDSSVVLPKSHAALAKAGSSDKLMMSRAGQPPSLVKDIGTSNCGPLD